MPELPEVEIVRQSLEKKVKDKIIQKVLVKNRNLRFKIHSKFKRHINKKNQIIFHKAKCKSNKIIVI